MADDILVRFSASSDSTALRDDIRRHLEPVLSLGSRGKENASQQVVAALAKRHVPFLAQLLKQCSSAQSTRPGDDALDDICACAVDALALLRPALNGRPLEIEVQRYGLVRRLVRKKRYGDAMDIGWTLYRELCSSLGVEDKPKGKKRASKATLPLPKDGEGMEVCNLVVGAVLNLLLCSVEGGEEAGAAPLIAPMLPVLGQLDAWLGALGADAAQKHRDSIFRYLYKGSLRVATEAAADVAALPCAQAVVAETLRVCLLSPSRDRFSQIAVKVCGALPPAATVTALCDAVDSVLECGGAVASQRQRAVLPLLDAVVRACAAGGSWAIATERVGAAARSQAWANGAGSLPLAGAYLAALEVGAQAAGEATARRPGVKKGGRSPASPRGLELLAAADSAAVALAAGDVDAGEAPGALRALDALRRQVAALLPPPMEGADAAAPVVALGWDGQACGRVAALLESAPAVLARALAARGGAEDAAEALVGFRLPAVSALVAAARLRACGGEGALLGGGCVCDPAAFSAASLVGGEGGFSPGLRDGEVRWLAGAMHNLGVELFKLHRYAEATGPLRVAVHAASIRAGCSRAPSAVDAAAVSDAVNKCVALASCLSRAGDPGGAVVALAAALARWCGHEAARRPLGRAYSKLLQEDGVLALPTEDTCLPLLIARHGGGEAEPVDVGEACEEALRQGVQAVARAPPPVRARLAAHLEAIATELLGGLYSADRRPVRRARVLLLCDRLEAGGGRLQPSVALPLLEAATRGALGEDGDLSGGVKDLCALAHVAAAALAVPSAGGEAVAHVERASELWSWVADALPDCGAPLSRGASGAAGGRVEEVGEDDEGEAVAGAAGLIESPRTSCEALMAAADLASLLGRPSARDTALAVLARLAGRVFARVPSPLAGALPPSGDGAGPAGWHAVCVAVDPCPVPPAQGCEHGPRCDGGGVGIPCAVAELRGRALESGDAGRPRPASLLHRARLHLRASELAARAGALGAAHADAQEALRLLSRAYGLSWGMPPPPPPAPPPPSGEAAVGPAGLAVAPPTAGEAATATKSPAPSPGGFRYPSPWRVAGEYLGSLMHLGRLMDLLGMGDEAVAVVKEAAQVAGAVGAPLARAAALELLARLQRRRRLWDACQEAAAEAEASLASASAEQDGQEGPGPCRGCTSLLAARVQAVRGDMARRLGDCAGSSALYRLAEETLAAASGSEDGGPVAPAEDRFRSAPRPKRAARGGRRGSSNVGDNEGEREEEHAPRRGGRRGAGAKEPAPKRGDRRKAAPPPDGEGGEGEVPEPVSAREGPRGVEAELGRTATGAPHDGVARSASSATLVTHILVQRARCLSSCGDDGAARECLVGALSRLLGGDADAAARVMAGDREAAARPGLPAEMASVLLHLARLDLRAMDAAPADTAHPPRVVLWAPGPPPVAAPPPKGRSRGKAVKGGAAAPVAAGVALEGSAASAAALLLQALDLCREAPLLLRAVTAALREVYGASGQAHAAWMFHDLSLGASVRQLHLTVTHGKLAAAERAGGDGAAKDGALRTVCAALRPPAPECAGVATVAAGYVEAAVAAVPVGTTLCSVGCACGAEVPGSADGGEWLLVSRLEVGGGVDWPLLAKIPLPPPEGGDPGATREGGCGCGGGGNPLGPRLRSGVEELRAVLGASASSMDGSAGLETRAEKTAWWQGRLALDERMRALLERMQDEWLGPWRCLLAGVSADQAAASRLEAAAADLASRAAVGCVAAVRALLVGAGSVGLGVGEVADALHSLGASEEEAGELARALLAEGGAVGEGRGRGGVRAQLRFDDEGGGDGRGWVGPRGPVVLVADPRLQGLPWESIPALRAPAHRAYRMPSLGCARALRARCPGPGGGGGPVGQFAVDLGRTFFLLNPSGDLGPTQEAFQGWFAGQAGWEGKSGEAPTPDEYADALSGHDLLIYFGHGGGEQFLPPARLRRLGGCAATLLMGCSSGRLADRGDYEPTGVALAYLVAGSPTALANLWDVTDRDIDRFSRAVLERWLGAAEGREGDGAEDIAAPVGEARGVCRLPNLIGAAPVCYGIPTPIVRSEGRAAEGRRGKGGAVEQ